MARADDRSFIVALSRGLEVLRCFTPADAVLGNQDISRRTGLPKATVARFVYTLLELGYLQQGRQPWKYRLGLEVLSLGYPILAAMEIRELARPLMEDLATACRGVAWMGLRQRLNIVIVEVVGSTKNFPQLPSIGLLSPIAASALGSAFLAGCAAIERAGILNQIKLRQPELYRRHARQVERRIWEVRDRGYCLSSHDLVRDAYGVAAPLRANGEILAFGCAALASLTGKRRMQEEFGPRLRELARRIEKKMLSDTPSAAPPTRQDRRLRP